MTQTGQKYPKLKACFDQDLRLEGISHGGGGVGGDTEAAVYGGPAGSQRGVPLESCWLPRVIHRNSWGGGQHFSQSSLDY